MGEPHSACPLSHPILGIGLIPSEEAGKGKMGSEHALPMRPQVLSIPWGPELHWKGPLSTVPGIVPRVPNRCGPKPKAKLPQDNLTKRNFLIVQGLRP